MKQKQIIAGLGILINKENNILVSLRNDPDQPDAHNKWEIPGGGVEFGETIKQTVKREMKEEIGVDITFLDFPPIIKSHIWRHPTIHVHVILIGYICSTSDIPHPANEEIKEIKWVSAENIDDLEFLPLCDEFVKEAIKLIQSS